MSFMRNFALYSLMVLGVGMLIALLVFWLLDKPLYLKQSENLVEDNAKLITELSGSQENPPEVTPTD